MDGINIKDLTIEQYLRLTQENQTPCMVKKFFEEELSSEEDLDEWLEAAMKSTRVTDMTKVNKIEAKRTKPGTGMKRVQENEAEDEFISNLIPLILYPK
nr:hypothetical protein [Tanacetum cinerariifolium]